MLLIFYAVAIVAFFTVCAGIHALMERVSAWTQKHLH